MARKPEITVSLTPTANPTTPEEWQNAVDAAEAFSVLHSAKLYGLVTGGPEVDIERRDEILEQAKQLGISPRPDAVERFAAEWNRQGGA